MLYLTGTKRSLEEMIGVFSSGEVQASGSLGKICTKGPKPQANAAEELLGTRIRAHVQLCLLHPLLLPGHRVEKHPKLCKHKVQMICSFTWACLLHFMGPYS
ncbi:hypothetical protein GDO78_020040 [Eleutherodactylus coqui]|uniref:Uncharacterized protein n=1 Tax=Eleutherodactylus coqui TaxID=57060 RepID=A0A8J6EIH4_ELECQ|nr:hypothetical protein GDO78_020040 [Eleutherodactylus coqui]